MRPGTLLRLALFSALSRRSTLALMLLSIALGTTLLLGIERIRADSRTSFVQSVSGVDLIAGPRTGGIQLMLYAVFHSGNATHNMRWDSFQSLSRHPAVAWAVPLSLGDSHRGFAVLGTDRQYFEHFRYGERKPLAFVAGEAFARPFEAVIGSELARQLGYRLGDSITLSHGSSANALAEHGDKPFTVVGILARTGTPVDRTVHVSLESITAIHLDWIGGAPIPGITIPAEQTSKFDLTPKQITATLIGLHQRSEAFRVQRAINTFRDEPLMAIMPGVALDELWETLDVFERALQSVSLLVVLVSLSGLAATLLAGLNERRRELAILRSLGAGPQHLFALLAVEGLLVASGGALIGLLLVQTSALLLAPVLQENFGITLSVAWPSAGEWLRLAGVMITGLLASLIPAWRVWRMSLADGLTPQQ